MEIVEIIIRQIPSGIALGFVTSQPLANFYLTDLDHRLIRFSSVSHTVRF